MFPVKFSLPVLSITIIATLSVCKPSSKLDKNSHPRTEQSVSRNNTCDRVISYHIELVKSPAQEVIVDVDLVINPSSKMISFSGTAQGEPRTQFETVIETMDCQLNADLTQGYAVYTGYTKLADGTTTPTTIKVESKDGKITLTDPNKNGEFFFIVSKWSVVS